MVTLMKLIDTIIFFYFLVFAIGAPLLDAQTCLPSNIFPQVLINLKTWYTQEFKYYLFIEKPHFFVGLVWLQLVFAWPLSIASLYGIVVGKSWLPTTCLMFGVSTLTAMSAMISELLGSGKASEKILKLYFPFMGFAILAIIRGLLPHSFKSNAIGKRPVMLRKKRA
uniref:sigma intracellular receptor 2-like n=1 Tax=Erigeron canadensis TaxID=72917 RepID=UPI001CB973EE|nr:sigma intracellular receptor 2-like [Erigeron canadensis]